MDNRGIAIELLRMCARGEVRDASARHVADDFIHHNAWFAGDRESLLLAMEQSAAAEPNKSFEVKQAIAEGDRVAVLSQLTRADGNTGYAVVHIVRIREGQVVELWDLAQEIPADPPNVNGMF